MQAILNYQASFDRPIVARTAVGSLERSFTLPIELSGVSLTINGAACGLRSVSRHKIEFVLPPSLASSSAGTVYPMVLNNNGVQMKSTVTLVPARPDIFNVTGVVAPGGRTKIENVTNRVHTTEPFTVTTLRVRPPGRTATVLRVYLTGAQNSIIGNTSVRIGQYGLLPTTIQSNAVLVAPGVYTIDFLLDKGMDKGGDQPIIVTIFLDGVAYTSRLDDTTSVFKIL